MRRASDQGLGSFRRGVAKHRVVAPVLVGRGAMLGVPSRRSSTNRVPETARMQSELFANVLKAEGHVQSVLARQTIAFPAIGRGVAPHSPLGRTSTVVPILSPRYAARDEPPSRNEVATFRSADRTSPSAINDRRSRAEAKLGTGRRAKSPETTNALILVSRTLPVKFASVTGSLTDDRVASPRPVWTIGFEPACSPTRLDPCRRRHSLSARVLDACHDAGWRPPDFVSVN